MMLITLLRTYREHQKLSLRDMARRTGISHVTLHRLEHGKAIRSTEWSQLWRWLLKEPK